MFCISTDMQKRRWYDKNNELAQYLNGFKEITDETRVFIIQEILALINNANPHMMEDFISHYRLDLYRHRWYDADLYLWLIYNGLAFGDSRLNKKVLDYLKDKVSLR